MVEFNSVALNRQTDFHSSPPKTSTPVVCPLVILLGETKPKKHRVMKKSDLKQSCTTTEELCTLFSSARYQFALPAAIPTGRRAAWINPHISSHNLLQIRNYPLKSTKKLSRAETKIPPEKHISLQKTHSITPSKIKVRRSEIHSSLHFRRNYL